MVPIFEFYNESVEQDPCLLLLSPLLKVKLPVSQVGSIGYTHPRVVLAFNYNGSIQVPPCLAKRNLRKMSHQCTQGNIAFGSKRVEQDGASWSLLASLPHTGFYAT
ncbi:hypothetical protein VNO80_03892 [Phaseolus coccineus]|uniref:Uncharacterized protein n=1 Tax=Phaseolus coccineus TaxID=3886 RepID=A0AAN9NSG9_PHACN